MYFDGPPARKRYLDTRKPQLKFLEGFHQRCLRQILHIKWQSHVSDTEV